MVMLILDESADVKYGKSNAGSSRQHNGRLGKVEQSQVGVYLSYAKDQCLDIDRRRAISA